MGAGRFPGPVCAVSCADGRLPGCDLSSCFCRPPESRGGAQRSTSDDVTRPQLPTARPCRQGLSWDTARPSQVPRAQGVARRPGWRDRRRGCGRGRRAVSSEPESEMLKVCVRASKASWSSVSYGRAITENSGAPAGVLVPARRRPRSVLRGARGKRPHVRPVPQESPVRVAEEGLRGRGPLALHWGLAVAAGCLRPCCVDCGKTSCVACGGHCPGRSCWAMARPGAVRTTGRV